MLLSTDDDGYQLSKHSKARVIPLRQGNPVKGFVQRVRSRPFWYVKRVPNPLWWARQASVHLSRKRSIAEANRVLSLLTRMHWGELEDLVAYRNRKLSEMLEYAHQHCRYYRYLFEQFDLDPQDLSSFERLPLLDKAIITKHRDDIVSDELSRLDFVMMNTGGSTGEPLEFPVSFVASRIDNAHQEFLYRIIGYEPGDKIAGFGGSSIPENLRRHNIYWIERDSDLPYGRLSYSSLYLTKETVPFYVQHVLECKPAILRGYPSFLNDLAIYILRNRAPITFRVKGIELTAENAYHWQIENIKEAFNTQVFFQYGHSEASVFGYTVDDSYEYFCSPFYGLTEVLDSEGAQVSVGKIGEIAVTGFYNFALPFIRYRTGDLALFNGDEHGIVRLGKVLGRTQDYIYTRDRQRVALTALVFGQHYHAFRNIQKWQLVQNAPGRVVVRIIRGEDFSSEDREEISRKFRSICDIDTHFEFVDSIPLTPRGKFKFLVQNIEPERGCV